MPDLSIIVVSYNTRELTRQCLRSVQEHTENLAVETVLVDNASKDGSAEMVTQEFPDVQLVTNSENLGFAAANNQAFKRARGRFVLLLNPDTEVFDDAIGRTLRFAENHSKVGVVGCRARYPSGEQQSTIFREPRLSTLFANLFVPNRMIRRSRVLGRSRYVGIDLERTHHVEVVAGCFMLVRRDVLEQVGGMDESFFMYGEEVDWCHRIRKAGWFVVYYPEASVLHHGGGSSRARPTRTVLRMARSQLLLFQKLRGPRVAYVANLLMLIRDLPRAFAWGALALLPPLRHSSAAAALWPAVPRLGLHLRGVANPDWRHSEH